MSGKKKLVAIKSNREKEVRRDSRFFSSDQGASINVFTFAHACIIHVCITHVYIPVYA